MERIKTMRFPAIVRKLTDTDLYKFTMGQVFNLKYNRLIGTYVFKCRNEGVKFTQEMVDEINLQIDHLCTLTYTEEELQYLSNKIKFLYEPLIIKAYVDILPSSEEVYQRKP